jgi:hypothetical protein
MTPPDLRSAGGSSTRARSSSWQRSLQGREARRKRRQQRWGLGQLAQQGVRFGVQGGQALQRLAQRDEVAGVRCACAGARGEAFQVRQRAQHLAQRVATDALLRQRVYRVQPRGDCLWLQQRLIEPAFQQPRAHRRAGAVDARQQRVAARAVHQVLREFQMASRCRIEVHKPLHRVGRQRADMFQRGHLVLLQVAQGKRGGVQPARERLAAKPAQRLHPEVAQQNLAPLATDPLLQAAQG